MIDLAWLDGDSNGGNYKGNDTIIGIGRDGINHIILNNPSISSFHAALVQNEAGRYFVRDLASLNGIRVNDSICYRKPLQDGDRITICDVTLTVRSCIPDLEGPNACIVGPTDDGMDIPIGDVREKGRSSATVFGKTTTISLQQTADVVSTVIADLCKIGDFDYLSRQLLKEVADTFLKAKQGYVALFDEKRILKIRHRLRDHGQPLPEIPQKLLQITLDDERVHFYRLASGVLVATIPIRLVSRFIGFIYAYDIPLHHLNNRDEEILSILSGNQALRRHLETCFGQSGAKRSAGEETMSPFRWREKFVGHPRSPVMEETYRKVRELSPTDRPIVLLGESGSGKTALAKKIHDLSRRSGNVFVRVDFNTITENLIESEIFGTMKGAFTGSTDHREGYFEYADGGTVFLDEIGNLSLQIQKKLLLPLDDHPVVRRMGSMKEIPINVRLIAATNRDIESMVKAGEFREDLYRRLGIGFTSVFLPPLRERKHDIPLLAHYFIDDKETVSPVEGISHSAMRALMNHEWRGNVGTLRIVVTQAKVLAMAEGRKVISLSDLPEIMTRDVQGNPAAAKETASDCFPTLEETEKIQILAAITRANHNKSLAAELLGITRPTLNARIKKYDIEALLDEAAE
jgi:DNA-binding NtrC family response regulator